MKLMVLNLPPDCREKALANLFKSHGDIKACDLIIDDKTETSKGFGFVEMALKDEAEIAVRELHGSRANKNKIRVKPAV